MFNDYVSIESWVNTRTHDMTIWEGVSDVVKIGG